jgi:hypothetical protein
VDERWLQLLLRQHASGFDDLRGAEVALTVPVSERLLNEAIAEGMPRSATVRDLHVRPLSGDRFAVRFRIGSSAWLPAISLTLSIVRQPAFPGSPVLILKMESSGLLALAGPALRFLNALPEGIRVEDDRIHVDLAALMEARGLGRVLAYLTELTVTTLEGALVVNLRAAIKR